MTSVCAHMWPRERGLGLPCTHQYGKGWPALKLAGYLSYRGIQTNPKEESTSDTSWAALASVLKWREREERVVKKIVSLA